MFIPKEQAIAIGRFHLVDPSELDSFEDWTRWLEAVLHNPCSIFESSGDLLLLENKQLVVRLNGLRIEIYPDEHPPPHFHVKSPEVNASFAIEDCRLLNGSISAQALQKVKYWHKFSKPKIIEIWNSTRPTNCGVGPYSGA